MRMLRLQRADWLLLIALVVLGAGVVLVLTLTREPQKVGHPFLEVPSTFYNDEGGTKAAYLALDRLGIEVGRIRRAVSEESLAEVSGLLMLRPTVPVMDHERKLLLEWVRRGHTLLIVPGSGVDDWFNWQRVTLTDAQDDDDVPPPPEEETVGHVDDDPVIFAADVDVLAIDTAAARMTDPIFRGIDRLTTRPAVRFDEAQPLEPPLADIGAEAQVIWRDEHGAAALRIELGRGTILAFGDSYALSNVGLGEADNALLLANIAAAMRQPSSGGIAFDEYHLGFEQRDASAVAIAKLLLYGGRGWAMAHLALLGVLALIAVAVRFGKPRDIIVRQRRRQTEFIEAAARLLEDARGLDIVRRTLLPHYRRRLLELLHLDPAAGDPILAEALKRQAPGIEVNLAAANPAAPHAGQDKLLRTVQQLHHAVETLEHGTVASDRSMRRDPH